MRTLFRASVAALAVVALAACNDDGVIIGGGSRPDSPRDLAARYEWTLEGFAQNRAVGHPAVRLTWLPPARWDNEVFRVYGKRSSSSSFALVATVTSCTVDGCVYVDRNVRPGEEYEYFVSTYDETRGTERDSEFREEVFVPPATRPQAPRADSVTALDNALFPRWSAQGSSASLWKYQVYLTRLDEQATFYQAGETDGTGFLDLRARNGSAYTYRVAAVDTLGHVSDLSGEMTGVPRPDAAAELIYSLSSAPAQSGFRFMDAETADPIVDGTSAQAHWRLEADANGWRIVPLNGTGVLEAGRTTALACGPGADASCRAVTQAPAAGYQTTPITVTPEFSYVFSVRGSDGQPRFGVVRAEILGKDSSGRDLMIFSWAYQTRANDLRLTRSGG